jgi:4-aminobutyrate aminotransferase-like enzyme
LGTVLVSGFERIQAQTDHIKAIRGRGLMAAIDLKDDADASFTVRVHRELVRRGYVLGRRPGVNVLRLDPALTIDLEDIEGFLETFEDVLIE